MRFPHVNVETASRISKKSGLCKRMAARQNIMLACTDLQSKRCDVCRAGGACAGGLPNGNMLKLHGVDAACLGGSSRTSHMGSVPPPYKIEREYVYIYIYLVVSVSINLATVNYRCLNCKIKVLAIHV